MFRPLAEVQRNTLEPRSKPTFCDKTRAKAYALSLLGSYRGADVADPAVYVANTVAVLCRYPEWVAAAVCGPGIGIQTRQRWLPTVSEVREACEHAVAEEADRERRALLSRHRVLIDTPHGPKPQAEAERINQEDRDRAVRRWEQDVRPHLQTVQPSAAMKGEPKGLSPEERRAFYVAKAEELRRGTRPLPKLSAEALRTVRQGSADFYADDFMEAAE